MKILRETFYKELYTILFTNNNEEKKGKKFMWFLILPRQRAIFFLIFECRLTFKKIFFIDIKVKTIYLVIITIIIIIILDITA